ncbi:centromere protein U [Leptodactylus fuscus]|uniref:centromere protein U n=1 Tax=Leptodactylus fuscus TaxID=238119 RepID=UPI003F4EBCE6
MSAKKNKSKAINQATKSPKRQNVRNQGSTSKAHEVLTKVNELMNKKVRSPLLKEIAAHADISSILKEPGDALQEDVEEDSFNPPLHSTAVYTDDEQILQASENPAEIPAKPLSPIAPVVQEENMNPKHRELKSKPAANREDTAHRPADAKPKRTPQKKAPQVQEPGSSKKRASPRNLAEVASPKKQTPNTTPNRNVVSAKKKKTQGKDENTPSKKKSRKDKTGTAPTDIQSPENIPKSVSTVNELDVVLFDCGKLIEQYRENVETDACKRAIDVFSHSFKEQLTTTILDQRKLKDVKRKNAKMLLEIGRKRRRLIEVKGEIIVKQHKLDQLQKECSELEKRQDSLKSTRVFLDGLAQLKDNYMKFKAKNPNIKETYGMSSLPALCLEAENVMRAEQHFHILNRELETFIDRKKGDS